MVAVDVLDDTGGLNVMSHLVSIELDNITAGAILAEIEGSPGVPTPRWYVLNEQLANELGKAIAEALCNDDG